MDSLLKMKDNFLKHAKLVSRLNRQLVYYFTQTGKLLQAHFFVYLSNINIFVCIFIGGHTPFLSYWLKPHPALYNFEVADIGACALTTLYALHRTVFSSVYEMPHQKREIKRLKKRNYCSKAEPRHYLSIKHNHRSQTLPQIHLRSSI